MHAVCPTLDPSLIVAQAERSSDSKLVPFIKLPDTAGTFTHTKDANFRECALTTATFTYAGLVAINNLNQAVGSHWHSSTGDRSGIAPLHLNKLATLNDLISPSSGWNLSSVTHLDDTGRIVGYGVSGETGRSFMLTPQE